MYLKNIFKNINNKEFTLIKTHKNHTRVYFNEKKNFYRKTIKSKKGIDNLVAEYKGLSWYCNLIDKKKEKIIKNYNFKIKKPFLDIINLKGFKIKSWRSLEENYSFILKTYKHYKNYFPKKQTFKIHGDLTLDNIIYNNKKIFIIDWEYFNSKKNLKGYDLAYFFLSSLCLPYIAKNKISEKDEKLFLKLWKFLHKMKINKKILYNPFSFFEHNIKNDRCLKIAYKISKAKFFPFITDIRYKKRVLKIINNI